MTTFKDTRALLATLREDPETAAMIDTYRDEAEDEMRAYRDQLLVRIFADVTLADELPEQEQSAALSRTVDLILEDPGMAEELEEGLLDLFDPEDYVREAILTAANPVTGRVTDESVLPDGVRHLLKVWPEATDIREEVRVMIAGDTAERVARVREEVVPRLDAYLRRHDLRPATSLDADVEAADSLTGAGPAVRGGGQSDVTMKGDEEAGATTGMVVGSARSRLAKTDDKTYILSETRILREDGRFNVELRLRWFEQPEREVFAHRDEWRVVPVVNGKTLEVKPHRSPRGRSIWVIAEPLSVVDVEAIEYTEVGPTEA